jgi:hypothetical protein
MLATTLRRGDPDPRVNERKSDGALSGILMRNPEMPVDHPLAGSLGLWVIEPNGGRVSMVSGWPRARWWTSALHFWDDFSADGELGPDSADPGASGCRLRAARSRARRDGDIHVPHHVALPEPHA